jgi:hypothetical protein
MMRHSMATHTPTRIGVHRRGQRGKARRRWPPLLLALLLPLAALGGSQQSLPAALRAVHDEMVSPVATVAQLERALVHDPAGWGGRIVLVRAIAARDVTWQAPDSLVQQLALIDSASTLGTLPLAVTWGQPDALLATLRRFPLLGSLMPTAQRLQFGTMAVYRVQLRAPVNGRVGQASAVLLDADPGGS